MNEWNIQSRAHACQACSKGFSDKQPYHTLLLDLKHEVQRRDVCEPCWKAENEGGASDRKGFISHWQGVYEAPPAAPPEAIQKESAETLLRKIMELNDPSYAAASYILAAMLERKRLLKVKEQVKRDGQRIFIYEQPSTGDLFSIPDPNLQLNQLDQVQRDVADLLENGFPVPMTTITATTPVADAAEIPSTRPAEDPSNGLPAVEPEPVVR